MDSVELYKRIGIESFQKIDFATRYFKISDKYKGPDGNDLLLKKIDNMKVLEIFHGHGYTAKRSSPGKDFFVEELYGDFRFQMTFVLTRGMVTKYLGVYFKGQSVDVESNLAFLYRHIINDKNASITAPCFQNYDELSGIVADSMAIYKDFKDEFLKSIYS